nr:alpha/beta hydrolase [Actinomadura flavalba]
MLHGFPTSSVVYGPLIGALRDDVHLIAPDLPGFGHTDAPAADAWDYTFDHLTDVVDALLERLGVTRYALHVHDYGAPVGFRLALRHPERVTGIVSQNGNAYEEGLTPFWEPIRTYWADPSPANTAALGTVIDRDAVHWQYTHGVPDVERVDPSYELHDHALLTRPGNAGVQLALLLDYRTNPPLYPVWQEYLRTHRPPVLAVWGANDNIFAAAGAEAFARDVPDAQVHLLDAGHFPFVTHAAESADLIRAFLRALPR